MRSHPWLAAHPYKEVPLPPGGHPENVASLELQLGVCLCMYSRKRYLALRHLLLLMYQTEAHWLLKQWVLLSQMLAHLNNQNNVFKRTRIIAIFS